MIFLQLTLRPRMSDDEAEQLRPRRLALLCQRARLVRNAKYHVICAFWCLLSFWFCLYQDAECVLHDFSTWFCRSVGIMGVRPYTHERSIVFFPALVLLSLPAMEGPVGVLNCISSLSAPSPLLHLLTSLNLSTSMPLRLEYSKHCLDLLQNPFHHPYYHSAPTSMCYSAPRCPPSVRAFETAPMG